MSRRAEVPVPQGPGVSPFDTWASSGTRFVIEIVAWVAGPWAAADAAGTPWAGVLALVVLFGLPALCNTPGDKSSTVVPTPGSARVVIEMVLLAAATLGAWIVWPQWAFVLVALSGGLMVAFGLPRYRWLAGTRRLSSWRPGLDG